MNVTTKSPFSNYHSVNLWQVLLCSLLVVLGAPALWGQGGASASQGEGEKGKAVSALKESVAKNQAALKQYSWTETTQVSLKGEVKKEIKKQCQYGPDGKVQKTPIGDDSSNAQQQPAQEAGGGRNRRGGAIKKEVVKKKVDELKDYMDQVSALVKEYVPPDSQKIQAAQAAGNISLQPAAGGAGPTLDIKNYVKQGDSLDLGLNATTKKLSSYNVRSYLDNPKDDPVTMAVTFNTLPDGTNYAQQTVLNMPAKNMQVKMTNSDYKKTGQ